MTPLYNLGIYAMGAAARIAALRPGKIRTMLAGQKDAIRTIANTMRDKNIQRFDYWFHVASLGEFEQARPIIEGLRNNQPKATILLTFFSPSGYTVRYNYPLADCVAYLPFDTPSNAKRLMQTAQPRNVVFVKYEFWGNYISTAARFGAKVYLVSAIFRPGQIFFKPWGLDFRKILRTYSHIFVQDDASEKLLRGIGLENITVAGDTRLDRVASIAANATPVTEISAWLGDTPFVVVAGSSWQPDEKLYIPWLTSHPGVKAIIAPHEFDDRRLSALCKTFDGKATLLSKHLNTGKAISPSDTQVIIVDSFGLLARLYRYASVAIVGGGFGAGIHNINEAAAHGVPVIFGPNNHKFKEASDLIAAGAAAEVSDANSMKNALDTWCEYPDKLTKARKAAKRYIDSNVGATTKILDKLL